MDEVYAVIPARSGSKSIIDKNLQEVGGTSLIELAIDSAKSMACNPRVVVSTDSEVYAEIATARGAEVPFLRSPQFATDQSTDFEFFRDIKEKLGLRDETTLVHIRPTTPFRQAKKMDEALEQFMLNRESFTSLRSVHMMAESSYKSFEISNRTLIPVCDGQTSLSNKPRQSFPATFVANGYIDIFPVSNISQGDIHGDTILAFETQPVIEIDSLHDLEIAQAWASWKKHGLESS